MDKLNLILGIHSHQPVGNFDFVFQNAFQKAYLPFLEVIREHPTIHVNLHFSGVLFDWFESHQPAFLDSIKELVEKGQAELLTGGYYEPILPILPDVDKLGQITKLSSYIRNRFDFGAKGAWVAERVWEPHLAKPLAVAGVEFVILDDSHFKFAGLKESDLSGYFVTEEQGICLKVFPIDKKLRYLIPFAETDKVLEYLQELHRERSGGAVVIVDDGEKFGIWPGTYTWVYEKGWLHRFLDSLEENREWLRTVTFSDFLSHHEAQGRIYLPSGSYEEMMEWALPYEARVNYEATLRRIRSFDLPEQAASFFKGGFWRNFLVRYPESNHLHKRMLGISEKIQWLEEESEDLPRCTSYGGDRRPPRDKKMWEEAREDLYRSQCNDVYWHGIFGGLYLPHLRHAAYAHLIRSESLLDDLTHGNRSWVECHLADLDADGLKDLAVTTPCLCLFFDLDQGGSLVELDYRPQAINLANTMTRRPEAYHSKVGEGKRQNPFPPDQIKTIHEMEPMQDQLGLEDLLCYDWYRRGCLLDHFLGPEAEIINFSRSQYPEWGDFINQKYEVELQKGRKEVHFSLRREGHIWFPGGAVPVRVEKEIFLRGNSGRLAVRYSVQNLQSAAIQTIFGTEFNLNLLGESAPDRYYRINGNKPKNPWMGSWGETEGVEEVRLVNEAMNIFIHLHFEIPARLWRFPVYTVSQSESGFEKIYQGSSLLPHWDLSLGPWEEWNLSMQIEIGDPGEYPDKSS
jgi:alpha-amylase